MVYIVVLIFLAQTFRTVFLGGIALFVAILSTIPADVVPGQVYESGALLSTIAVQCIMLLLVLLLSWERLRINQRYRAFSTSAVFLLSMIAGNLSGLMRDSRVEAAFDVCVAQNGSTLTLICGKLKNSTINSSVPDELIFASEDLWGFFSIRPALEQGMDLLNIYLFSGFAENIQFPFNLLKVLSLSAMLVRITFAVIDSIFLLGISLPFGLRAVTVTVWQVLVYCALFIGVVLRRNDQQESLMKTFFERLKKEKREKRALYRTIADTKLQLKEKQAFVATVAHEVRTPLHGIVTLVDLLRATAVDQTQMSYLASLRTSVQSLVLLVNDVLDASKLDAGKFELNLQETNIDNVVRNCCRSYYLFAIEKGLELGFDINPALDADVLCDSLRLTQVS